MSPAEAGERWRRPLLVSLGVHLAVAVWILGGAARLSPLPPMAITSEVSVDLTAPAAPVVAPPASGGEPARGRRARRPHPEAIARAEPPVPVLSTPATAPDVDDEAGTVEAPVSPPGGVAGPMEGIGGGGTGAGDGVGGIAVGRRGRPRELVARVVGSGSALDGVGDGAPLVSLKEATALRIRDYFPRLPAASWPETRPYIVQVGLCVSEAGSVTEAVLQSSASPALDPVVLAAVRGWRYRPRIVDGQPARFCHAVTIAYERAF